MSKMATWERRLKWLRSAIAYTGSLNIKDYTAVFGIEKSQVSRDRQRFSEEIRQVLGDEGRLGKNGTLENAQVSYPPEDLLPARDLLGDVLRDRFVEVGFVLRKEPEQNVLRNVVAAIKDQRTLAITYTSSNGTTRRREIQPHSVVDADGRLHVRARDTKDGGYKDFVLTRMSSPVLGVEHGILPSDDREWMKKMDLVMKITDPDNPAAGVLMKEYGINEVTRERRVKVRSALMPYVEALYTAQRYEGGTYPVEVKRDNETGDG